MNSLLTAFPFAASAVEHPALTGAAFAFDSDDGEQASASDETPETNSSHRALLDQRNTTPAATEEDIPERPCLFLRIPDEAYSAEEDIVHSSVAGDVEEH